MKDDRHDIEVSYLGHTTGRGTRVRFGIRQQDRLSHLYAIGQTGVGKTTLLESLARQDWEAGRGFALLDPHGDLAERLASTLPLDTRLTYLDAPSRTCGVGYNPLRRVADHHIPLAASGLIETLRKLWPLAWGVRMEHVLRNSIYALLERDGAFLPDILKLFRDRAFRRAVTSQLRNPVVRQFWQHEFESYPDRMRAEAVAPIQNKLGALLSDPALHRTLVAPQTDLHFRSMMDEGRPLLVNLARGRLGEDSSNLLGGLLVSTIALAAFTRADVAPDRRRPFFLYVDEFQSFTTLAFVNMLSELRKFGVGLTLANQYLAAIEPEVRYALLGNVGTLVAFRVGPDDAPVLARELQPVFAVEDLINLPNHHIYLRLMIDGTPSRAFSARTEPPSTSW